MSQAPLSNLTLMALYAKMYALHSQYLMPPFARFHSPDDLNPVGYALETEAERMRRAFAHDMEDELWLWPLILPPIPANKMLETTLEAVRLGRSCKVASGKHFYLALLDYLLGYFVATPNQNEPPHDL